MMTLNTSAERVDRLIQISDNIYDTIDPKFEVEARHRRMLRVGVNTLAISLRNGESLNQAGSRLVQLPSILDNKTQPLDILANTYADIERATVDRSGAPETDSRHAIHLMKIALPYAQEFYPSLGRGKVAAYALLHDIIEAYAGDVPSLGMSKDQENQKHHDEARALITLRQEYGDTWPELISVIEDYEALKDIEARYTKTIDKIDPSFGHFENQGLALKNNLGLTKQTFLTAINETTQRIAVYSGEFPQLMHDREELIRRVAAVSFQKAA